MKIVYLGPWGIFLGGRGNILIDIIFLFSKLIDGRIGITFQLLKYFCPDI